MLQFVQQRRDIADAGGNRFMADITKVQARAELHRAIWAIADELRGSVDGWDFKSNVLEIGRAHV